jgi:hypothetical protein
MSKWNSENDIVHGEGGEMGQRGRRRRREKDEAYLQGGYPLQTSHIHLRICFMRHIVKNNFVSLSNKKINEIIYLK